MHASLSVVRNSRRCSSPRSGCAGVAREGFDPPQPFCSDRSSSVLERGGRGFLFLLSLSFPFGVGLDFGCMWLVVCECVCVCVPDIC